MIDYIKLANSTSRFCCLIAKDLGASNKAFPHSLSHSPLSHVCNSLVMVQVNGGPAFDKTFFPLECRCGKGVSVYYIGGAVRLTHDEFGGRASIGQTFNSIDLESVKDVEMEPGTPIASLKVETYICI